VIRRERAFTCCPATPRLLGWRDGWRSAPRAHHRSRSHATGGNALLAHRLMERPNRSKKGVRPTILRFLPPSLSIHTRLIGGATYQRFAFKVKARQR
jgi:hypothetical protein